MNPICGLWIVDLGFDALRVALRGSLGPSLGAVVGGQGSGIRGQRSSVQCTFSSSIRNPKSKIQNRIGLSLLEVILALAILGLSLAAITQLVSLGARAARESRDLTKAQIIAESVLAELSAEVIPVENTEGLAVPHEPDWVYSTLIEGTDEPGLIAVHVVVEHVAPPDGIPLRFIVTRWFVDPEVIAAEEEAMLEPTGADL